RLLEAERRDAERADVIFARERDHPAVTPGHVDDLAIHAELLEIARRPPGFLGDFLPGPEHPDRYRERLRADVELELPVSRLDVDHGRRLRVQRTTLFRHASAGRAPGPRRSVTLGIVSNRGRIRALRRGSARRRGVLGPATPPGARQPTTIR